VAIEHLESERTFWNLTLRLLSDTVFERIGERDMSSPSLICNGLPKWKPVLRGGSFLQLRAVIMISRVRNLIALNIVFILLIDYKRIDHQYIAPG